MLIVVMGFAVFWHIVLFPQLQGKCQSKSRKDGARLALFLIFVLFCILIVL
jgi:hypothetical protein